MKGQAENVMKSMAQLLFKWRNTQKFFGFFYFFFCLGCLSHKILSWVPAFSSCLNQDCFVCFQRTWFLGNLLEPIQGCWNTFPFSIELHCYLKFQSLWKSIFDFVCISSELVFILNPRWPGRAFVLIPTRGSQTVKLESSELTFECLVNPSSFVLAQTGTWMSVLIYPLESPIFLQPLHLG